ncbi:MAG: class I SAM-dependent RNA methyltransferase [Deltaproteobacteria bacterium]|nr:class I SAM-dependent RNA methyltransferase [Deltaproteobacteria bacterium]
MSGHVRRGDIIQVTIDTVAFGGDGIGRIDRRVVFVPFTAEGDIVDVEIVDIRKKYVRGIIHTITQASPKRIVARCPYYYRCGGCQYQHISYHHQLRMKERQVTESFERIGKIPSPPVKTIIFSSRPFNYRGKAEYHLIFRKDGYPEVGFMDVEGGTIVDVEQCEIVDESINRVYRRFREALMSGSETFQGDRFTVWSEFDDTELPQDRFEFSTIGRKVKDKIFFVPQEGFFQTNISLVDTLVDRVLAMAAATRSDVVLDLYCGSGLFSVFVSPCVRKVYGIEMNHEAARCARLNMDTYGVSNTEIVEGRVEDVLKSDFIGEKRIDAVILDPPRVGCGRGALARIAELKPSRIIYVSCNPTTQARDVRYLLDEGFSLMELQPIDMFPQTKHIEVIALLER